MKLFLLNALITPFEAEMEEYALFSIQKIEQEKFENIFRDAIENDFEIVSALGHKSTINFLKEILSDEFSDHLKFNRQTINFEEGDLALVFRITERGEKIQEWSVEDIKKYHKEGKTEFMIISRTFAPDAIFDLNNFLYKEAKNG
ncbi:MAG: YddF family protein [Candidatus Marinimicrobia bacterium]|nr:YddF family protein [Candidatus Neomarinimicrobiota bacterium]